MMDCPSDDQLRQFLDGDGASHLPERPSDAIDWNDLVRHIESCDACTNRLERITASSDLLLHPPPVDAPSAVLEGLLDDLKTDASKRLGRAADHEREPEDTPVPVIPGYTMERFIGRGGMGTVFYAIDEKLQREVAVKVLNRSLFEDRSALIRFRTEALAIAQLNHPSIIEIYDVGQHDGVSYLTLEYVAGGSLRELLKTKTLNWNEAAIMIEKVARGVHYAHEHGFIHRDLKPANILCSASGDPKISDFGLAKNTHQEENVTRSGDVIGTPGYMAPEQLIGTHSQTNAATDIYALGAMFYEMICERPLFPSESTVETLIAIRENQIPRPSAVRKGIPVELETICLKCLEKNPASRYASAEELGDELRRFVNRERIATKPKSFTTRVVEWGHQHPLVATLVAALLIVGPALSALAGNRMRRLDEARVIDSFHAYTRERNRAIQASLVSEIDSLEQVRSLFNTMGSVSREEFATFASSMMKRHPAIAALEWAPIISAADRVTHESSCRDAGFIDYLIRWKNEYGQFAPAGDAEQYVPVFFVEPFAPNRQALGFDLNSEPSRQQALEESQRSMKPTITQSLRLVQDASDAASVLVVLAVPGAIGDRLPRGYVIGVYRVGEIVESALSPFEDLEIQLLVSDPDAGQTLWTSSGAPRARPGLSCTDMIEFGSRRWELEFMPTSDFVSQSRSKEPTYAMVGGMLASLLGACLVMIVHELMQRKAILLDPPSPS